MFPNRAGVAGDTGAARRIPMGLLTYCFAIAQKAAKELPGVPDYTQPQGFVREAARLGASAIQIAFGVMDNSSAHSLREQAAAAGVVLEATVALPPKDADVTRFAAELRTLQELGVKVARTVVFPGRRYEDFQSIEEYKSLLRAARERLRRAEPLARKHRVQLAVENHKDQRIEERVKLLEEFGGEYIGACVDVGNNLAMLEDPVDLVQALLPWARTVHFKDQGVREVEDGFLLADVPLGEGCIDLREVVRIFRTEKPEVHLQLELITRDPLRVPILRPSYWRTFPEVKAAEMSRAIGFLKSKSAAADFPTVSSLPLPERVAMERRNIEQSFAYAAQHLFPV